MLRPTKTHDIKVVTDMMREILFLSLMAEDGVYFDSQDVLTALINHMAETESLEQEVEE